MFQRYAIYFTPSPDTPLARFGAAWLGWDSASGVREGHPQAPGLDVATITATPRKYGFHGTIKPPFVLADGMQPNDLESALRMLCAHAAPVHLEGLELSRLGSFLALTPKGDAHALGALAAKAVEDLDPFRAPPSDDELARRRSRHLSPAQEANLSQWGYPYVRDQFRFHLTLTGRMTPELGDAVIARLQPEFDAMALAPYRIDALTLLGSDADGHFHQLHRVALSG